MNDDLRLRKDEGQPPCPQSAIGNRQPAIWKSPEAFRNPEAFLDSARNEFPPGASELDRLSRRNFLKLVGGSLALAGLPACTRQPMEKIVPYVQQPEQLIPGRPLYFATAMTLGGFATGLVAESHEGHPTKIEGNPLHPASLGATNIFHQAALLDLYDPDRSQTVRHQGNPDTWENFIAAITAVLQTQQSKGGAGLRILTETVTSLTLHSQIHKVLEKFPAARWHQFEPVNRDNVREGARLAFGAPVEAHYHFEKARIIVSLESDFLARHPNSLRYARAFADRRRAGADQMNRLYVVESSPSVTGSNADHRFPLRSSDIESFTLTLAAKLGLSPNSELRTSNFELSAIAADLVANHGQSIIIAGDNQPPSVHALAHRLNHFLGNIGNTITFAETAEANPVNQLASLSDLAQALKDNAVDALIIIGGNPAFTAPADFGMERNLAKAGFTVHLSPSLDETSTICSWHIPQNHFLESWGDARGYDGTVSIIQPLILPLYAGKSTHEILDVLLSPTGRSDYDIVHDYWAAREKNDFESFWRRTLHDGVMADTALPEKNVSLRPVESPPMAKDSQPIEITFQPDSTIFDGRFANNAWLQELPKPVTGLVWDNSALVSPAFARQMDLSNGDVIELETQNQKWRAPVWITPGQAPDSIALSFGYGRRQIGRVGKDCGFDAYRLRTSKYFWRAEGVVFRKTGERYPLVTTQTQHVIDSEERQILREATFADFQKDPGVIRHHSESPAETLFKEIPYDGYRWGMAIDLGACIGCGACTMACQAENNIPTVGKTETARGRSMHWIRVDTYFRGAVDNPAMTHQPVPCMHCEHAPCEVVCPVAATLHDKEGLNLQVYNRCIGTRYCSNNCPYKVRRFNFFQYADDSTPAFRLMRNPNVTVRTRGVMEKCTYCVQRISAARIDAEEKDRKIGDGQVQTACQQVCPANAIVFGDLNDPKSRVARLQSHPLNYSMLGQLNTRPRTTYLAKLRNPNPKLA